MEVSGSSKDWVKNLLNGMRTNQDLVALHEMQEFAGGSMSPGSPPWWLSLNERSLFPIRSPRLLFAAPVCAVVS